MGLDGFFFSKKSVTVRTSADFTHRKWRKIEHPEQSRRISSSTKLGTLSFVITCSGQNWRRALPATFPIRSLLGLAVFGLSSKHHNKIVPSNHPTKRLRISYNIITKKSTRQNKITRKTWLKI